MHWMQPRRLWVWGGCRLGPAEPPRVKNHKPGHQPSDSLYCTWCKVLMLSVYHVSWAGISGILGYLGILKLFKIPILWFCGIFFGVILDGFETFFSNTLMTRKIPPLNVKCHFFNLSLRSLVQFKDLNKLFGDWRSVNKHSQSPWLASNYILCMSLW